MAMQNVPVSDEFINAHVEIYTTNHAGNVRDLAEVIDDEDPRAAAFRACVSLYAEAQGITNSELSAALTEWQSI